jgi:uncharacterized surface protein with fasciclin (FAS1) repeats
MHIPRRLTGLLAGAALVAGATVAAAPAAHASTPGNRPLANVLLSDGNTFDSNRRDFDIVTEAALAVLADNPNSPVKVITQGKKPLTAFLPTDQGFRLLVKDLTGTTYSSEKKIFGVVESLGLDTVEAVLLYHVVPGLTITSAQAVNANGAELPTELGPEITVWVSHGTIRLVDQDLDDWNPKVIRVDVNKGNKQIAHGINYVLRPIDL